MLFRKRRKGTKLFKLQYFEVQGMQQLMKNLSTSKQNRRLKKACKKEVKLCQHGAKMEAKISQQSEK